MLTRREMMVKATQMALIGAGCGMMAHGPLEAEAEPEPDETIESLLAWVLGHNCYIQIWQDGTVIWSDCYGEFVTADNVYDALVTAKRQLESA